MKSILSTLFSLLSLACFAQSVVSGKVTDMKGNPIPGANIYIDGSYDGASSDEKGQFSFTTSEKGKQVLVVSFLAYETSRTEIEAENATNQTVKLKESVNTLDAVVITAGTFEAGDKARVSVLKPLDIVTTAGSAGDIVAALQTLPGTQTVGEDGRLYVRGGEADETQTFVDGIRVAQPYGATTNELPTRGRFSPFLFSGISFSTGGYSAEYGEALSSVLLLNTQDEPDQNKTDISLMTVGLGFGHTKKWQKSSLSVNTAYIDLAPYQVAIPQDVEWNRPYQSLSGETVYRYQFEKGLLKVYAAFDAARFDVDQETVNAPYVNRVDLQNNNFYLNSSYLGDLPGEWQLFTGLGYGYSKNTIGLNLDDVDNDENALHLKVKLRKNFSDRFKLSFGADYFVTAFDEVYQQNAGDRFATGYDANLAAAFAEGDIFLSKNFAAKIGIRASHNSILGEATVSPRVSLAYKIKRKGQFSFAYGEFSQAPRAEYLKFSDFHQFDNERARHYILNYQYSRNKQTFRLETYLKEYRDLVKFSGDSQPLDYNNDGSGYAKGIDVFWRDGNNIRNLEYWVSYSFIDTQRDYKDFPTSVTPNFVASHSLSVVTKYWINSWRSQLGVSNSFATGRPFNNPNDTAFMASRTKSYNNMSVSWAYLLSAQKILYFSVSNVLGNQNIFGYEYADTANANGIYERRAIRPTADRFFFVGFFWTISDDKKSNQLDNL
ncbi:TonB-dependent receptor plug domain-containing protein [Flavobacterium longum]|uniref:TonB-dependent receptor n=1 Tax=Flavobacterium longum TaxID=1299340 RepID=UPI0039EB41DA